MEMDTHGDAMSLSTVGPSSDPGSAMIAEFISAQRMLYAGPSEFRAFGSSSVLIVGGNWNNGASDGLSAWNSNNDLSNSNTNIGARLAYPLRINKFNITLGQDRAPWQKITKNYNPPAGRRACGYGRPNVGIEVDRVSQGVCL